MSDLMHLQDKFQSYLMRGNSDFKKLIISTEKVSAETRLLIYSNAYRSRLHETLVSNYPILSAYLGDDIFEKIAGHYIDEYPSEYRSIRWFGDHLAGFLNNHHEYKEFPYLSELAQFEWNMTLVFDAADSQLLSFDEIASIPPEAWIDMRFRVHPTMRRINFSWNVVQIWQAISNNQSPPEVASNLTKIPWILWRYDLMSRFTSLTEDEAWAIDAVIEGLSFGEICEGLCNWVDEENAGIHAASLLKGWIQSGLLAEVFLTEMDA